MPRTFKGGKQGKKSSGSSGKAAASSNRAKDESPSVRTLQQNVVPNGAAGLAGTSASPREQTKVVGARMSGVKHSGLLAKDAERRLFYKSITYIILWSSSRSSYKPMISSCF